MRNLLSGTGEQEMRHPKRSNNFSCLLATLDTAARTNLSPGPFLGAT